MSEKRTEQQEFTILEVKEVAEVGERKIPKLPFKVKVNDKEFWYFTFSKRLFETIQQGQGKTCKADVEISEREYNGDTYIDHKVTEIYIDGQPVGGKSGGFRRGGSSPEELELKRKAYALSYAKDLAVADKIKVNEITKMASEFADFMQNSEPVKPQATNPDWDKLGRGASTKETKTEPKKTSASSPRDPSTIKTTTELQYALHQDFGLQPKEALAELNIKSWSELSISLSEAYIQIKGARG